MTNYMDRTDARIRRVKRQGKLAAAAVVVVCALFGWALAGGLAQARELGDEEGIRAGLLGLLLIGVLLVVTVAMVWRQHHYLDRIRDEVREWGGPGS